MSAALILVVVAAVTVAPTPSVADPTPAATWVQASPATSPPARLRAAMAFYPAAGNTVLFGGVGATAFSDTWTWDGATWAQRSPATSPSARYDAAMAYHPATSQMVLFGGGGGGSGLQSDTWTWDGVTWTQQFPATSPPPRAAATMAFHPTTGQLVLFGGFGNGAELDDTWTWDGTTWTQRSPATTPPARSDATMALDPATGQPVLFGGYRSGPTDPGDLLGDTWTWDGTTWTERFPATSPPARVGASMASDPVGNQVVLFGGGAGHGGEADTWTWDGTDWALQSPPTSPPARAWASMTFDPIAGKTVLFGGFDGPAPAFGDTWTYAPPPPSVTAGTFTPLAPTRILDTRSGAEAGGAPPVGVCVPGPCGRVGSDDPLVLQVTGAGGVPAGGVSAVVMNVTVTGPNAPSFLTVYPSDAALPTASNLNYVAGQTVPNLVVVKVGGDGRVKISNHAGSTHVIADVMGWYGDATAPPASRLTALTPTRILDTRSETGGGATPVGSDPLVLQVAGAGGVPATGVSAVVMNVTVTEPSADSFLTVYPSDAALPTASNLNYVAGQTVPNLVVGKVGGDGRVKISNHAGSTHVVADVVGWYGPAAATSGSRLTPLPPTRILDTRSETGGGATPVGSDPLVLQVTGAGGVPASGVGAVVMNVTVTGPSADSFLTVYPSDAALPIASNLNYVVGQTVPNLVLVKVGADGRVKISNYAGSTHVVADVVGWFDEGTS